jgi:hypothetical protein
MTSLAKREANKQNAQKSTGPTSLAGRGKSSKNALRHGLLSKALVLPCVEKAKDWEAHKDAIFDTLKPDNHVEAILVERIAIIAWRLARLARYENETLSQAQKLAGEGAVQKTNNIIEDILQNDASDSPMNCKTIPNMESYLSTLQEDSEALKRFILAVNDSDEALEEVSSSDAFIAVSSVSNYCCYEDWESFFEIPEGIDPFEWEGYTGPSAWEAIKKITEKVAENFKEDNPLNVLLNVRGKTCRDLGAVQRSLENTRLRLESARTKNLLLEDLKEMDKFSRYEAHLERSLYRALHELERMQVHRSGGYVLPPAVADVDVNVNNPDVPNGGFVSQN